MKSIIVNLFAAAFIFWLMVFTGITPAKAPLYYWVDLVLFLLNMLVIVIWAAKKTMP